jgi:hypothetical protein
VLHRRTRRAAASAAVLVALGALTGCGAPAKLDRQEQVAFARACASLIERNVVQADPPVRELDGEQLDLDDPTAFYSTLERLRGPDTFDFHKPDNADNSPKDMLDDNCRPRDASRK